MKEIKKQDLEKMYNEMTNEELAKKLGISRATLVTLVKESGIKQKGSGNRTPRKKIKVV